MSTLFISDIHLCEQGTAATVGFLNFLKTRAATAKALYILGDLFEIWIGDDNLNALHRTIAIALQTLNRSGIPCYFIHGNHDFLLGPRYASVSGMRLLPMQKILQLYGQRIVVLHGDALCTDDTRYQKFRRRVHKRWLQRLFLNLPLWLRLWISNKVRFNSTHNNINKITNIDVNLQTVMTVMEYTGAKIMIHGHTHRPAIHYLIGERYRAVLGAWHDQGSAIEINDEGITLVEFSLRKCGSISLEKEVR